MEQQQQSTGEPVKQAHTEGQQLVGITFNPSMDPRVDKLKALFAEAADILFADAATPGDKNYRYNLTKGRALGDIMTAFAMSVKLVTLQYL